ncbi:MAG: nucleoside 2-deoxyribosyltransferase [Patescibacteria group bacterium]
MKILIGSSMRFRDVVKATIKCMNELGLQPLCPNVDQISENRDVADSPETKKRLALEYYEAIEKCDAVYFIVPEGYIGTSLKIELGYALALKKPVYFSEPTKDIAIDTFAAGIIPLNNIELFKNAVHLER